MAAATIRSDRNRPKRSSPAWTEAPAGAETLSEVTFIDHAFLGHDLAEQACRAENQNEHQHRESEDVAVLGADRAVREHRQKARAERLENAEKEAAEHG